MIRRNWRRKNLWLRIKRPSHRFLARFDVNDLRTSAVGGKIMVRLRNWNSNWAFEVMSHGLLSISCQVLWEAHGFSASSMVPCQAPFTFYRLMWVCSCLAFLVCFFCQSFFVTNITSPASVWSRSSSCPRLSYVVRALPCVDGLDLVANLNAGWLGLVCSGCHRFQPLRYYYCSVRLFIAFRCMLTVSSRQSVEPSWFFPIFRCESLLATCQAILAIFWSWFLQIASECNICDYTARWEVLWPVLVYQWSFRSKAVRVWFNF